MVKVNKSRLYCFDSLDSRKINPDYCGKNNKQKGKLKNAVKKFLHYLGRTDVELQTITRKYVKRYVDKAVEESIPYNTLFSELVHLRAVWKHAVDEELIPNSENPFYGHDLQYLKKPQR